MHVKNNHFLQDSKLYIQQKYPFLSFFLFQPRSFTFYESDPQFLVNLHSSSKGDFLYVLKKRCLPKNHILSTISYIFHQNALPCLEEAHQKPALMVPAKEQLTNVLTRQQKQILLSQSIIQQYNQWPRGKLNAWKVVELGSIPS